MMVLGVSLLRQYADQCIRQQQQQKIKAEFLKTSHCDTMQHTGRCLYVEQLYQLQSYSQPSLLRGTCSHMPYKRVLLLRTHSFIIFIILQAVLSILQNHYHSANKQHSDLILKYNLAANSKALRAITQHCIITFPGTYF